MYILLWAGKSPLDVVVSLEGLRTDNPGWGLT